MVPDQIYIQHSSFQQLNLTPDDQIDLPAIQISSTLLTRLRQMIEENENNPITLIYHSREKICVVDVDIDDLQFIYNNHFQRFFYVQVYSVFEPEMKRCIINLGQLSALFYGENDEISIQEGRISPFLRRTISNCFVPEVIIDYLENHSLTNIPLFINPDIIPNYNILNIF